MLVEGRRRRNGQRRFVISVHRTDDVVVVGRGHVHPVRCQSRKLPFIVLGMNLQQDAIGPLAFASTRTVIAFTLVCGISIVIACHGIHAAFNLVFVAHVIPIGIVEAQPVAVVEHVGEHTAAVVQVGRGVIVARLHVRATFKGQGHGDELVEHRGVATGIGCGVDPLQRLHTVLFPQDGLSHLVVGVGVAVVNHKCFD